jgi:hypothetical protein
MFYDHINAKESMVSPSTMKVHNTGLYRQFQRYLLQEAMSPFKFTFPKTWAKDYVLYVLYLWGYFAIFNTDKFGVIPQQCGLYGYDVFYRPTHCIITNPLFKETYYPKIGKDCTLIKLQPDYGGIMDIVSYYAEMMALCSESVAVNLVNSKLSYVFFAKGTKEGEELKKIYDQVGAGEPCVVADKKFRDEDGSLAWEMFDRNVKNNYIASDILSDMKKIKAMFDTEIGIPNTNTDKKERMITSEVLSNNVETLSKCELWLEELQARFEEARNMFGFSKEELNVEWRFDLTKGGNMDESDAINIGAVPTGTDSVR